MFEVFISRYYIYYVIDVEKPITKINLINPRNFLKNI